MATNSQTLQQMTGMYQALQHLGLLNSQVGQNLQVQMSKQLTADGVKGGLGAYLADNAPGSPPSIWGDIVNTIQSIPQGAEHDADVVMNTAKAVSGNGGGGFGAINAIQGLMNAGAGPSAAAPYSTTPGTGTGTSGQYSSAEDTYHPSAKGAAGVVQKTDPPTTQLFNLQAAVQPYVQPYENMMDTLLGSKPGKAPTVAQAETAGMSQLAPYLQGLPSGLASTITKAAQPEFAAAAGLPSAVNASVQTEPYAGLLTDLISAARNQMIYGAGIGTPTPPGALGAIFSDVTNAGTGLSGLGGALGLTTPATTSTTPAPSSNSIPGS